MRGGLGAGGGQDEISRKKFSRARRDRPRRSRVRAFRVGARARARACMRARRELSRR
jgi:hypothetical protein